VDLLFPVPSSLTALIEQLEEVCAAVPRFNAFRDLALAGISLHDFIETLREHQNAENLECNGESPAGLHHDSSESSGLITPRQP